MNYYSLVCWVVSLLDASIQCVSIFRHHRMKWFEKGRLKGLQQVVKRLLEGKPRLSLKPARHCYSQSEALFSHPQLRERVTNIIFMFNEFVELSTFHLHFHRDERHILQSVIQTFCRHNSEFLTLGDDQFDVVRSDILWTIALRPVVAVLRTLVTGTRLVWSSHKRSFLLWGSLFACSMKSL